MNEPFSQIVTRYGETVLRICRSLLDTVSADDAWSETFLAALTHYDVLPRADAATNSADEAPGAPSGRTRRDPLEAWLVTTAKRKCLDIIRTTTRTTVNDELLADHESTLGVPGDGDIWMLVAQLPERQRHALAHHYLLGLDFASSAAILGGSAESLRRAASDGRRALRRALELVNDTTGDSR